MDDEIAIPKEFGGSLAGFCRDWCLGSAIAYSAAEISRGLTTLKRLWPEEVARIVNQTGRGTSLSVSAIDDGILLENCENAKYFRGVLDRLKSSGQRSAYSELVLVSALRRLGYAPQFEAPVGDSVPDAHCVVDGVPISFEVYAPDQSYASQEQRQLVRVLQEAITHEVSSTKECEDHQKAFAGDGGSS
jgi:hypothetical protein